MTTIIIDVDNHRHNGDLVPRGAQIDVDEATAVWMIARNKAHAAPAAPVTETPKPEKKDK